jgi:hypothetical protein
VAGGKWRDEVMVNLIRVSGPGVDPATGVNVQSQ